MKRIYGTIIYLIIFMDSAGKLSGKWNLVKLGTVFPPQISCMGRIVPCRLVMKVTVIICFNECFLCFCKTFIVWHLYLKINTNQQSLCTVYNETLWRRKNKILSFWFARLNNTKRPLLSVNKYQIIDRQGCLSTKCFE